MFGEAFVKCLKENYETSTNTLLNYIPSQYLSINYIPQPTTIQDDTISLSNKLQDEEEKDATTIESPSSISNENIPPHLDVIYEKGILPCLYKDGNISTTITQTTTSITYDPNRGGTKYLHFSFSLSLIVNISF